MPESSLLKLPTELLIQILSEVDLQTILRCKALCQYFNNIVTNDATLQYKLELELSGMEDGPPSGMVAAERLQCLREHQSAWAKLRYSQSHIIQMERGNVWELYGNVLAQGRGPRSLAFYQIPSAIRGIEAKSWVVENLGVDVRDFGMDPAEDLLVFIARLTLGTSTYTIHLRTLSEGKPHPSSPKSAILQYTPLSRSISFMIQTSGELLGIVFETEDRKHHLVIWNWKTGLQLLAIHGDPVQAFMFLTQQYIAITKVKDGNVSLVIIDLHSSSPEVTPFDNIEPECEFLFPDMSPGYTVWDVIFRSDPGPEWTPNPKLQVPFHVSRKDRLFIITVTALSRGRFRAYTLFVPTSTLLHTMETLSGVVEWEQWGPTGTRLISPTLPISPTWVCYVYGTKFTTFQPRDPGGEDKDRLYVFDINQLAIRKGELDGPGNENDTWTLMVKPNIIKHSENGIFSETIRTALPLRYRILELESIPDFEPGAAMISEDAAILVGDSSDVRQYRILTF